MAAAWKSLYGLYGASLEKNGPKSMSLEKGTFLSHISLFIVGIKADLLISLLLYSWRC